MKRINFVITILLFILGILCYVFFEIVKMPIVEDPIANHFLNATFSRMGLSLLFIWLLYIFGGRDYLLFNKNIGMMLLWSLPCFMVAIVNFPWYSTFVSANFSIARGDLIGLYILYIVFVALAEELIFRGVILVLLKDWFRNVRHAPILITVIGAGVFALFHLTNLFIGVGIGDVLLQCAYTFLIGAMLMVTMLKTKNIWICVVVHAIFNYGGLIQTEHIGSGEPWDLAFWILTIVSGVLCAGHIIYTLIKLDKNYASRS